MADEPSNPNDVADGSAAALTKEEEDQLQAGAGDLAGDPTSTSSWKSVWQMPTFFASLVLLTGGLSMLVMSRPPNEYNEMLEHAARLTDNGKYDDSLATLYELELYLKNLTIPQQIDYHLERGDVFYLKQMSDGGDADKNLMEVVHEYDAAENLGGSLDSARLFRMTDALISLSLINKAMDYFHKLPTTDSKRRHRILKRLVDRNLSQPKKDYKRTYDLLAQLANEPDLSNDDRIWVESRTAELRMDQGFTDEAITGLLVAVQKFKADGIHDIPELFVLLGRGYYESGRYNSAREHLTRAQDMLPSADAKRGRALLYLGRIAQAEGDWDRALSLFDLLVTDFPGTRSYMPGLLGRAEIFSQTGRHQAAIDDYKMLTDEVIRLREKRTADLWVTAAEATSSLMVWHERMREHKRFEFALRYLKLAERLYDDRPSEMPTDLLLALGETHSLMGDDTLSKAREAAYERYRSETRFASEAIEDGGINTTAEFHLEAKDIRLDPATKQNARRHFINSGHYYRLRAAALQVDAPNETVEDLRQAAIAYDKGGELDQAVECLKEFIRLTSANPFQVEGIFKLGRVYQALDDHAGAIAQFKQLIAEHPNSLKGQQSYVLLAKSHLQDVLDPNPAEAERLLLNVVNGGAGLTPDAIEFTDALIELGTLYIRSSEYGLPLPPESYYPKAIQRFTEVLERTPDHVRRTTVQFRLGHAYRLSAEVLVAELEQQLPDSERLNLEKLRTLHMGHAIEAYNFAIEGWEMIPSHKRTRVEEQNLKFARFWRADSAFALGDYKAAIPLYNEVVERYDQDAITLMAMVQIINTYAEMGDFRAARAAQNRARRQLKDMPEDAFKDGLLNEDAWEKWLLWERELDASEIN